MTGEEAISILHEEAHNSLLKEMQNLRYNDTDRATILELLLSTYGMAWVDAIEDILNSPQAKEMLELIKTVRNRRKGIVNG